jgi:hypothetical protein
MKLKMYEEVEYIIEQIDLMMWERTGPEMIDFSWKLGQVLSNLSIEEIERVASDLAIKFEVNSEFFLEAYWVYKQNPMHCKIRKCAK